MRIIALFLIFFWKKNTIFYFSKLIRF